MVRLPGPIGILREKVAPLPFLKPSAGDEVGHLFRGPNRNRLPPRGTVKRYAVSGKIEETSFLYSKSYSDHRKHIPDASQHLRRVQNKIWMSKTYFCIFLDFFDPASYCPDDPPRGDSLLRLRPGGARKCDH